jgi:ribosomal protein S11
MIRSPKASMPSRAAALLSIFVLAFALAATSAAVAAESAVHYTKESMQAYAHQLAAGEIQSATFNKRIRSLHLTLKNGTLVLVHYGPKEEPTIAAALAAKGVPVTILSKQAATKEAAAKPVHHKLRYIVGGILIVVVIVVGAVLLVDRRRKQAQD